MTNRSRRHACRSSGTLVLATIVAAMIALPVHADEEAGPEDRARIAEALRAASYDSFEEVEFDDGVWEVDDAVGSDGREYDLDSIPTLSRSSAKSRTEVRHRRAPSEVATRFGRFHAPSVRFAAWTASGMLRPQADGRRGTWVSGYGIRSR
jgi:hypothetical protein